MAGESSAPIRSHWALRPRPHPTGDKDPRSGLVQPERVEPDHVVDAEIIFWIVALHVVVPDVEDIFPCDRYQRRILLHEVLRLQYDIVVLVPTEQPSPPGLVDLMAAILAPDDQRQM